MLNRAFFSLQSPWIPTWVALGNLGLNAVLDARSTGSASGALPLSTALVNIAGVGCALRPAAAAAGLASTCARPHRCSCASWWPPLWPARWRMACGAASTRRSVAALGGPDRLGRDVAARRHGHLRARLPAARGARAAGAALAAPTIRVIAFRPLEDADLPQVEAWLRAEHVARWWRDPLEIAVENGAPRSRGGATSSTT